MTHKILFDYALQFVGINYKWGGENPLLGYDCSGFVQELLMAAGIDPKGDQTAQGLYNYFILNSTREFAPGALVFFGRGVDRISHIGFCLDKDTMIEAGGGRSSTKTLAIAAQQNAFIRVRPINNRIDLGWCPYMSLWEINQIIYKSLQDKCYWYVDNNMQIEEAFEALGKQVNLNRIFDSINIIDSEAMRFKGIAGFNIKRL